MRKVAVKPITSRWFVLALLFGIIASGHLAVADESGASDKTLRTCREVRGASRELLATRPEVEIKAVATFVEPTASLLFVHDGTAGIYIYTGLDLAAISSGTLLTIKGNAQSGLYSPIIVGTSIMAGGVAELPSAEPAGVGRILSGATDSQWVDFTGVVRRDGMEWLYRVLRVYDGDRFISVQIQGPENDGPASLLDARVRVRGVATHTHDSSGRANGNALYVPGFKNVEVIEPPIEDPFAAPIVSAKNLLNWTSANRQEHLHRIQAVVTFQLSGEWLAVREGKTSMIVETAQTNVFATGTELEIAGFTSNSSVRPHLTEALCRPTGEVHPIEPRELESPTQLDTLTPGELVRFRGRLLGHFDADQSPDGAMLQVGSKRTVTVLSRNPIPADSLQGGAEYEVTAVKSPTPDSGDGVAPGRFWLQSSSAFRLVTPATSRGGYEFIGRDAVWLFLIAALATVWWWRHRHLKSIQEEMESALAFNRAQLVRAANEQARIARDLHDGIIQSIYAVGMRLEECRRLTGTAPAKVGEKLATTSEVLNHVIRDVRSFLGGLEPASIQGGELKTALKTVLLSLGDEAADRIALDIDSQTAASLTSKEATELFHICKEAVSNSLRHSGATRVSIGLHQTRNGYRVEISDDGRGFDPANVSSESRGLHNMRARATNLGAVLQLKTAPNTGTILIVEIPKA